jgi:ABC-type Fe3+-hydroxamate transport system substrate-binding protein
MDLLRQIVGLFHTDKPAAQLAGLQVGVDYARASAESLPKVRVFVPIWGGRSEGVDWWMTFNQDTYMSDLLSLFGGENVFAGRERLYPLEADLGMDPAESAGERDIRYPRVTAGEIIAAQPELILLPDDPYTFGENDLALIQHALKDTPAVKSRRVVPMDGKLLVWYGIRLAQALRDLPEIVIPG